MWGVRSPGPQHHGSVPSVTPWNFGRNRKGYRKTAFGVYKSSNIFETRQDRTKVTIEDQCYSYCFLVASDRRQVTLLGLGLSTSYDCIDHVILLQRLYSVFELDRFVPVRSRTQHDSTVNYLRYKKCCLEFRKDLCWVHSWMIIIRLMYQCRRHSDLCLHDGGRCRFCSRPFRHVFDRCRG